MRALGRAEAGVPVCTTTGGVRQEVCRAPAEPAGRLQEVCTQLPRCGVVVTFRLIAAAVAHSPGHVPS